MTQRFDFQGLVARAEVDNPDAALFIAIERFADARKALEKARKHNRADIHAAWQAAEKALIGIQPRTSEGAAAKLLIAARDMWRCPATDLRYAAMCDALRFLAPPKPRRRRRAKDRAG